MGAAEETKLLARTHQSLIWSRQRQTNQLRCSVRSRRLSDAIYQQAFSALSSSPGARAYYDQHRARGATHHQALRALGNRLVGILHGCLHRHAPYNEQTAWGHRNDTDITAAA